MALGAQQSWLLALYQLFANGDPTVTKRIKSQKQQSPVVSEPG